MTTRKKEISINWDTKINKTHEILAEIIQELLLNSYLDGNLSEGEINSAKAFADLKPKLPSSKKLRNIIDKMKI